MRLWCFIVDFHFISPLNNRLINYSFQHEWRMATVDGCEMRANRQYNH